MTSTQSILLKDIYDRLIVTAYAIEQHKQSVDELRIKLDELTLQRHALGQHDCEPDLMYCSRCKDEQQQADELERYAQARIIDIRESKRR